MKYKYKVIGYEKEDKLIRQLIGAVTIWVIAEDSGKALDKAKKMFKKKRYRVTEAHEITKNTALEDYNLQNLLYQKYRKGIDAEILKECKRQNKALERIAVALEQTKMKK